MAEYIEREAAIKVLRSIADLYHRTYTSKVRADMAEFCLKKVNAIPAADVVPVRHGRWVLKREQITIDSFWVRWECSECGCCRTRGWEHTSDGRKPRANFCEMCGALMDKDGDGE